MPEDEPLSTLVNSQSEDEQLPALIDLDDKGDMSCSQELACNGRDSTSKSFNEIEEELGNQVRD